MNDTLMAIIGIFVAVIIMFIFPTMEFAGKNDEISQTIVQVAVSDFVNAVSTKGKITIFDYNKLVQKLGTTGNSYDIQMEVKVLDDNPRRTTVAGSRVTLGEYKYYTIYTNTIEEKLFSNDGDGTYKLKTDDYITVTAKSTNITLGTQFKNLFYKIIGKDTYTVGTSASTKVLNSGT